MCEPFPAEEPPPQHNNRPQVFDADGSPPPSKPPRRTKHQKHHQRQLSDMSVKNVTTNPDNGLEVDQITIESSQNKTRTMAVQTTGVISYRLRFFPRLEGSTKSGKIAGCGKIMCRWFFSQIGLTVTLICWTLAGASAFYNTEGPWELLQGQELKVIQKDLAIKLSTELRMIDPHADTKWLDAIYKNMGDHESVLLKAVNDGYGEGGSGSIWTYPGCILFAVSMLTTLGFGAPVPRTSLGRGAAVLFSAIGIPLHFLLILNMGHLFARNLKLLSSYSSSESSIPHNLGRFLKIFPFLSAFFYYSLGVVLFGVLRQRAAMDCLMFPLDFTATGGVAKTSGFLRVCYALYLEVAVVLAATIVSLLQSSATKGVVDFGLRLGLLTNT